MLLLFPLLLLPLLTSTETTQATVMQQRWIPQLQNWRSPVDRFTDGILNAVDTVLPVTRDSFEGTRIRRKKKRHKLNKYIIPLIVGFMLIKSILLPIALKTLAILSGKAVVLSLMSLILAAIVGLKKVAQSHASGYEVVNVNKYKRHDMFDTGDDMMDSEPYKFYRERRRRK
ncbi:PREDICTED: uncharacterized protein LOC108545388 [Eufriesea mexicana]|uniref:uncharacterized protein LOC108545388 n=1 Tax=Eufriesea mexicana TaxID=516756 RepID=UPI00083BCEB4|nr:PREDICTED: uncharacterized protein LOC108545388 [Eufriesea mexicana]